MKRRQALQTIGLAPLAFALRCSGPTDDGEDDIIVTQSYYDPKIETAISVSDNGSVQLTTPSESLEVKVENESKQPLDEIQVSMIKSPEIKLIVASDPYLEYMPSLLFPPNTAKPASWQDVITLYKKAKNMTSGVLNNLAVKYLPEPIVNRSEHMNPLHKLKDTPFVVYEGDYSFNEIIDVTKFTTSIVTGIASLWGFSGADGAYKGLISVLREGGITMNMIPYVMDEIIEIANKAGLKVDKDKPYSWYKTGLPQPLSSFFPLGLQFSFFLPATPKKTIFDIKDYLPTKPGNKWIFNSEYGRVESSSIGVQNVDGRQLLVFESLGNTEYYGFSNDELRYFGFFNEDIGDVLFSPSLLIGDSKIKIGTKYTTTKSKIIFKDYPELEGSATEIFEYSGLEKVTVKAGTFGDCLKATEGMDLSLRNKKTGEKVTEKTEAYHWFAENDIIKFE